MTPDGAVLSRRQFMMGVAGAGAAAALGSVVRGEAAPARSQDAPRVAGAAIAGVAALAWASERALGWANLVAPRIEQAASHTGWMLVALVVAFAVTARGHLQMSRGVSA